MDNMLKETAPASQSETSQYNPIQESGGLPAIWYYHLMTKRTFPAYLEYDLEYGGYVIDVPSLPGCMSQGKTKAKAIKNIKEAISGYVAVLEKKPEKTFPIGDLGLTRIQVAV